jgi:hypothetical protein
MSSSSRPIRFDVNVFTDLTQLLTISGNSSDRKIITMTTPNVEPTAMAQFQRHHRSRTWNGPTYTYINDM